MTTMISEVFEAFRAVGVPEDKARLAAEALSTEASATKGDLVRVEATVRSDIARLEKEIAVLKWMVGLVVAGVAAQLIKLLIG